MFWKYWEATHLEELEAPSIGELIILRTCQLRNIGKQTFLRIWDPRCPAKRAVLGSWNPENIGT